MKPGTEVERHSGDAEGATPTTAMLWTFEFCDSGIGVWDREWHATEAQARAAHAKKIEEGYDPNSEMCGEEGDLGEVTAVDVELSPAGVLAFAERYAVDTGAA